LPETDIACKKMMIPLRMGKLRMAKQEVSRLKPTMKNFTEALNVKDHKEARELKESMIMEAKNLAKIESKMWMKHGKASK
jgi:hypothetical protein